MRIENPSVIIDKSGIAIDFLPVKEDFFIKFNLDGEVKGQKIVIEREEYKRAVRCFRLVKLNYDFKTPQDCKWYVGREERAIFWEVFEDLEDDEHWCFRNGLNIFCFMSDWRTKKFEGYQCLCLKEVKEPVLQKLKSLKSEDKHKKLLYEMEDKIGDILYNYVLMTNWLEWLQMVWSLNNNQIPFIVTVPEPNLIEKDVRIMLPALELSTERGIKEGLKNKGKDKEAQVILDAIKNIKKEKVFNAKEVLVNLANTHWKLWPWWSFVSDGIQSWLFMNVKNILLKTAKSIK